jgi:PKD repeat protein
MVLGQLTRQRRDGDGTDNRREPPAAPVWCVFLLLLLGAAIPSQATTYYLNTSTGNTSNPGTAANPWKTMAEVASKAVSGDIVQIQMADAQTYAALWPDHVSYRANTIQQFGITWKFSDYRTIGQFANGDFWVVGPVTITGITPASTSVDGRVMNGSMLNPSPTNGSQGYDSSMYANTYSAALNVAFNCSQNNPLILQPGSSLVSTTSIAQAGAIPQLERAAVLTVLGTTPTAGSFRPPYAGTDKTVRFNKSQLNYSLLRSLPPVSDTPSLSSVEGKFAAPWIDHQRGWPQRMQHPSLNMPDYGREIHNEIGIGGLMLHLNFPVEQKQTLMVRYVQLGIDFYGIVKAGGVWNWVGEGGHGGGRKWPILFAGMVLNDTEMKSIGQKSGDYLYSSGYGPGNCPLDYVHFAEDDQTFYVSQLDVTLTNGPSWRPDTRNGTPAPYTQADIGLPEWGIMHAHNPQTSDKALYTIYRSVACPPFHTTALAALLTPGAKELWNHNAYFDYTDRYVEFTGPGGAYAGYWHTWSKFTDNMWHAYRAQCGPIWPETATAGGDPVLSLIGDKQAVAGQTLTFTVAATDSDGDTLVYTATGLPTGATFTNRVFSWTPGPGAAGTHQVTFTVSDGSTQDSETITITVTRPNAAPVLTGIGNQSVNENQALSFSVSASDADSDTLTYSATGLPSGATFTGQFFKWTPSYTQAGIYNVTFIASDGKAQDSATITISVANVNRAPALAAIGDRSVDEENTLALTLSAVDPDGTALTYSAAGLPAGANLSGRNFTWTPTAAQVGSHEITFTVSDGALSDSETIQVTVVGAAADGTAPVVARQSPAPGAIQVSLNNLVALHVTDAGKGVAPESVTIKLDGRVVYQGDTPLYASAYGRCSRSGVQNDYLFLFQSDSLFAFDHEAVVTVNAADRAGNVMAESTYSFATEMRTFGANRRVSSTTYRDKNAPVTVGDSNGNIWAAWHAGDVGARDIYVARLAAGRPMFDSSVQITNSPKDQCDPDLAISADGTLYLVWQDNRQGHWDVFGAVSTNGRTFSRETPVVDANDNQTAPAVAAAGNTVFVAWQDDRNGNQDIYVGSSTNAFAGVSVTRVTTNTADQTDPDLAVGAGNTAYLVWTDRRNGQADIYGATSASAWANVALVTAAGDQTRPAVAVVPGTSDLHLVWVDAASGDDDIWYASSSGLPSSPLTGRNIIDDTSAADQTAPALTCTADGRVFVCWQDSRNVGGYGDDADVYFVELGPGCLGTNILIGDGGARSGQTEPAIALTVHDEPYVVWADDRDAAAEIYYAATSYLDPTPLYSAVVNADAGATIGIAPSAIQKAGDLSIVVPAGACHADLRVTISQVENPLIASTDCLGSYDFGPSGIEFNEPVTVTIPYQVANAGRRARAYWYNTMTGALSQQGITEIQNISLGGNLYALQFKTTHFTPYYLVANDSDIVAYSSNDGGSGGGCSMSATGGGSPRHLLVPYAVVAVFMAILRRRDKKRAARNIEA